MLDDLLKDNSVAQILTKEGERRMAQAALEGRFGTLSEDLLAALRTADEAALLAIAAHITTDTLDQVRARLGLA